MRIINQTLPKGECKITFNVTRVSTGVLDSFIFDKANVKRQKLASIFRMFFIVDFWQGEIDSLSIAP